MIKRILCKVIGHDYTVVKELTPWSRRLACKRCNQHFGMNDNVRAIIPWSKEIEEMYRVIGVDYAAQTERSAN